jgi:hypothetical protein
LVFIPDEQRIKGMLPIINDYVSPEAHLVLDKTSSVIRIASKVTVTEDLLVAS